MNEFMQKPFVGWNWKQ